MRSRTSALLILGVAAAFVAASAATAVAAPPFSAPKVIRQLDFETASATGGFDVVNPFDIVGDPASTALWGRTASAKHAGSYGFWAAGRTRAGATSTWWPSYPAWARSEAVLVLPQTVDYYSYQADLYYTMPSRGADDSLTLYWATSNGARRKTVSDEPAIANTTSGVWNKATLTLDSSLARQASRFGVQFLDKAESASGSTTGAGPTIDDLTITGYKYGPVTLAKGLYDVNGVNLSWSAPRLRPSSTNEDTRPKSYRVWRSVKGADTWTELTDPEDRQTLSSFVDTSTAPGKTYQYVIQVWDTVGSVDEAYGQQYVVEVTDSRTPPAPVKLSVGRVGTPYTWRPTTFTGSISSMHPSGSTQIVLRFDKLIGSTWVQQTALGKSVNASGGTFTTSVTLPTAGTWRVVASHPDDDSTTHSGGASPAVSFTVTDKVVISNVSASSTMSRTKYYTASGTLQPKHTYKSKPVRVYAYRYKSGKWVFYKYFSATATNYGTSTTTSRYSASIKLPYAGKWRLRAYHVGHSGQASTWSSSYKYVTVK